MWLAAGIVMAADAPPAEFPIATIIAAGIALVSAVAAAWLGARGTLRTADTQREAAFDKRVDERLVKAETRLEEVLAERDRYRECYVELRLAVIGRGLDPDKLVEEEP